MMLGFARYEQEQGTN